MVSLIQNIMGARESREEKRNVTATGKAKSFCLCYWTREYYTVRYKASHTVLVRSSHGFLMNSDHPTPDKCEDKGPELGPWHTPPDVLCCVFILLSCKESPLSLRSSSLLSLDSCRFRNWECSLVRGKVAGVSWKRDKTNWLP